MNLLLMAFALSSCFFFQIRAFTLINGGKEPIKVFFSHTHVTRLEVKPVIFDVLNIEPGSRAITNPIEHHHDKHIFQVPHEDFPGRGYIGLLIFKVDAKFNPQTEKHLARSHYRELNYHELANHPAILCQIQLNQKQFVTHEGPVQTTIDVINNSDTIVAITFEKVGCVAKVAPVQPKAGKGKGGAPAKKQPDQKQVAATYATLETEVWEDFPEEGAPAEVGRSRTTVAIGHARERRTEEAKRDANVAQRQLEETRAALQQERAAHQRTRTQAQEALRAMGDACVPPLPPQKKD